MVRTEWLALAPWAFLLAVGSKSIFCSTRLKLLFSSVRWTEECNMVAELDPHILFTCPKNKHYPFVDRVINTPTFIIFCFLDKIDLKTIYNSLKNPYSLFPADCRANKPDILQWVLISYWQEIQWSNIITEKKYT